MDYDKQLENFWENVINIAEILNVSLTSLLGGNISRAKAGTMNSTIKTMLHIAESLSIYDINSLFQKGEYKKWL